MRALFFVTMLLAPCIPASAAYHSLGEIVIAGKGGWDYPTFESGRLYLSHADHVVVVDTASKKIVGEVSGTPGVHAVVIAPSLGKGFTTNGKENMVGVFDLATLKPLSKIQAGTGPDSATFDSKLNELYVFNGKSRDVTVIDAKTEKVVATIALPGRPEFGVADPASGRVFVNMEDKNSLVVIDTAKHQIAADWKLAGCEEPSGLAIDLSGHHLFPVCGNETMLMVSSISGKIEGSVKIGKHPDAAAFDEKEKLVFSSNGEGSVTAARVEAGGKFSAEETIKTLPGARTVALDPVSHTLFLPTAQFGAPNEKGRPRPVDGTMKVLVYGP
ncbi:MAG: YncE family protein [Bdellovibrionota bacterium]